jgi:DNA-binding transcriptional LysR family regulator
MFDMSITLDQARALDALSRHGTFARAATALRKRHTAVLYALKSLEEQTGLSLLDRRAYRTRLTPQGEQVLVHARRLLAVEQELSNACTEMRTGWEPELRLVFDGIFPVEPILDVAFLLAKEGAHTRVDLSSEFLAGVERTFIEQDADLMITVLPASQVPHADLRVVRLAPIRALLVAHRDHPLGRAGRDLTPEDLAAHVLLSVRGSDPRLQLSTAGLEPKIAVRLNDFQAKKAGILAKMGYGWLPEHMIVTELLRGTLVPLAWRHASQHTFEPRLFYRAGRRLGPAARLVVDRLKGSARAKA